MEKETQKLIKQIRKGKVFVYPTDTVYGLGCDAGNAEAVARIKEIKGRDEGKPMSVIAPSFNWIQDHCICDNFLKQYLPGAYTLILEKKDKEFLKEVASGETLGVRIPDCEFSLIVKEANVPFVTTSVNKSGEKPACKISDIDKDILDKVDIIVKADDESSLGGVPSGLVVGGEVIDRKT